MFLKKQINPFYILTFFSCIYLTQIVPVSPFYFGVGLAFCVIICSFSVKPRFLLIKDCKRHIFLFFHCFLLCIYVLFNAIINNCPLKYPILQVLSFLFVVFSFFLSTNNDKMVRKTINKLVLIVFILLTVEFVYRISHPKDFWWATESSNFFYVYKFSSIMFSDTNETAFFVMIFISFLMYLNDSNFIYIKKRLIFIFFLYLVGTFSRAATFAFVFFFLYNYFFRKLNYLLKFLVVVISVFLLFFIVSIFLNDGSFLTKIDIFNRTFNYIKDCRLGDFFIGVGMNNSIDALGIYGHNYLSLYLVEYGVVGLFLFLSFVIHILYVKKKTSYLVIPFLVAGLSFMSYFIPYFFLFLGFIIQLEDRRK